MSDGRQTDNIQKPTESRLIENRQQTHIQKTVDSRQIVDRYTVDKYTLDSRQTYCRFQTNSLHTNDSV